MDLLLSDTRLRYMDADESMVNTNWMLGDLRSLHRCVPALRRTGITTYFLPPSADRNCSSRCLCRDIDKCE
jgi:hypothetical protein